MANESAPKKTLFTVTTYKWTGGDDTSPVYRQVYSASPEGAKQKYLRWQKANRWASRKVIRVSQAILIP